MTEKQHNISITATTSYIEDQSSPIEDRYVFAYTITITNIGLVPATLLRRHWLITDANCKVQEVRGDGVVGMQPRLIPKKAYQYTSAAVLETPVGCMQGSYEMQTDDGIEFSASIPVFNLSMPNALH